MAIAFFGDQALRLGEILAIRGWIEQQTGDFFADEWQSLLEQQNKISFRLLYGCLSGNL